MTELLQPALALWRQCPVSSPAFEHAFTADQQAAREARMDHFLVSLEGELRHPPGTRAARKAMHERLTGAFAEFGRTALNLEDRHLDMLLAGGFSTIGTTMAREARAFDPDVEVADIFQASRNAWTACGLQVLFGGAMCLSPSIFAYSMLYPYTDNYLDDPATPAEIKRGFNQRFSQRLQGGEAPPQGRYESLIWRLVERIESQYPRGEYPAVYRSLLMIQSAQEKSLMLMRKPAPHDGVDVLALSFEKGGASVLADGYLAAGALTPDQARFVFNWGVFLQLADDLQDVQEDRQAGVRTIFSQAAGREPLDALTNRLMQFGGRVMMQMHDLSETASLPLRQLITRSCLSFLVRSAGEAAPLYTPEYVAAVETLSPFRFAFLSDRRARFQRHSGKLARLFEAFLAGDPDEPAFPLLPSSLMPRW
ncbi:MAG TPA: hypothetical protein VG456_00900 [Candidatus Sulfopaludibacter sp.]|nr:hypothetical protein [Candidatus Sulfopaludibacter sp.]